MDAAVVTAGYASRRTLQRKRGLRGSARLKRKIASRRGKSVGRSRRKGKPLRPGPRRGILRRGAQNGRRVGRPPGRTSNRNRNQGRGRRAQRRGGGPVVFRTRRSIHRFGNTRRSNNSNKSANASKSGDGEEGDGSPSTTSVWGTYTCVIS